jgi:hypothetical protein
MNQVATINTNNFNAMAEAMGMSVDAGNQRSQASTLARLRINHSPIMGEETINGKKVKMEVVSGGTYKLEIPDGPTYYAGTATIRPYLQRFMYKRFIKGNDSTPNRYVKTLMANDLNNDMKDNDGGFNCGKPAGYIEDFKALPEKTQELIRQIKRVRVMFGTVELHDVTDAQGNPVDVGEQAFIWEIENRDAFKTAGTLFTKLSKMRRLPVQHNIKAATEERQLPNGSSFYLPTLALDLNETLDVADTEQETFANFLAWVENYNDYIKNAWHENAYKHDDTDTDTVEAFVDIDEEDFV